MGAAVAGTQPVRGHPDRSGAALDRLSHRADRRRAFDPATSTINNIAGQVVHPNTGEVVHGEYVVGWAKRGPTGLIGNNKADAAATVNAMVADLPALPRLRDNRRDPSQIEELLRERGIDYVTYADWQILDRYEVAAGRAQGRPRVKVTTVPEMMTVIREGR
jgi:ferredoxin--NADP+ reductase